MRFLFFEACLWPACLYALWRGGLAERAIAIAILIGVEATVLAARPHPYRWSSVELGIFSVDCVVLGGFLMVAAWSRRTWTLWIAALQCVETISHLSIALAPDVIPPVYREAVALWVYPMLALLALGTRARRDALSV